MNMQQFRSQFVPSGQYRFGPSILILLAYSAMATAVQWDLPGSGWELARAGGMRVGVLVLLFLEAAALTDFTRRPWRVRLLFVGAGMLAYALLLWPFLAWVATRMPGTEHDLRMARAAATAYNGMAGYPIADISLRASRLMAKRATT